MVRRSRHLRHEPCLCYAWGGINCTSRESRENGAPICSCGAGRLMDDKGLRRRVFESGVDPVKLIPSRVWSHRRCAVGTAHCPCFAAAASTTLLCMT